jgi:glycerol-3-phosphate acyltransferase PlsY
MPPHAWSAWLLAALAAFACGSIPFGPIVARARGVDLRKVGSGNIGATNVSRALGWRWGVLVYVLDALKGAAPVLAAGAWAGVLGQPPETVARADMWWWLMLPIAAVLGHMFSPFVGFRGGKGVATGSGAMLAVYPVLTGPVVIAIGLWAVLLAATRYMSVASIAAAAAIPLAVAAIAGLRTGDGTPDGELPLAHAVPALAVTGAVAVLVIAKHRGNIERLIAGTEHRLGSKKR